MTTPGTHPTLKRLTSTTDYPSTAQPVPTSTGHKAPKVAARRASLLPFRPDPHPATTATDERRRVS